MLEVRGLNAWYGESHILHGMDFDIGEGEVVTLLGRNGAGKTTTMKSIMGLVRTRTGSVKVAGVEGLKNIKIRVPDKNAVDMLNAVGMAPVMIPWGETIPALASGAVAGVSTSAVSGVDGKFWEFMKYIYPTNHVWSSQMLTVNLDSWKVLSADQQKLVADIAAKMEPEFWANSLKADVDSLNRLKEGGMEVVPVSDAMMTDIRARTAPLLEAFLKRVPAADKPVRAYLAEIKR